MSDDAPSLKAAARNATEGDDRLVRAAALAAAGDALAAAALLDDLPADLAHSRHLVTANLAAMTGDGPGWCAALNRYLARWRVAPVALGPGDGPLLDRIGVPAPPVTRAGADVPRVSVILAAFNAADTVAAAARSILAQTWPAIELIAVDDASTDGTAGVLAGLAAADPRLRVIVNPVNVGPYVSRNIALAQAGGAWVTLQDADDWSHPERIERHLRSVLKSAAPPPASRIGMLRMTPGGVFSQVRPVGELSPDGGMQTAPMSILFDAAFLKDRLGAWDCARFGADSEIAGRAAIAMGRAVPRLMQWGILALDHPGSLTNDPVTGIHPRLGVTPARQAYRAAWRAWHRTGPALRMRFPPGAAPFPRPPEAEVPAALIRQAAAAAGIVTG